MIPIVEPGMTRFDVYDDALIITINVEDLVVCPECPHLHIRLEGCGTPDRIREVAIGLLGFADLVERGGES